MNGKTLLRAAKKFIRHDLKYHVNSENIILYLRKSGYSVIFYDVDKGHNIIAEYKMSDLSKRVNAFTVCKGNNKYVFARTGLSEENLLCALVHETGHIILGHLSPDRVPQNKRLDEMEAETFSYIVLHHKPEYIQAICISLVSFLALSAAIGISTKASYDTDVRFTAANDKVIVTQSGNKYHREGCISIKNSDYIFLPRSEAEKLYDPCKICNP